MSRPATIDPFDILAYQQAGYTAQETALMLGIDRSWVYKLARQIGAGPGRRARARDRPAQAAQPAPGTSPSN